MPEEPILPIDDPRLKEPSAPVEAFDDSLRGLADRMFDIMDRAVGAGLVLIEEGPEPPVQRVHGSRGRLRAEPWNGQGSEGKQGAQGHGASGEPRDAR